MITSVIVIHDIPEGIAMAVPMRAGGFGKAKAFTVTVLSGVPMGIGALAGRFLEEYPLNLSAPALDLRQERCFMWFTENGGRVKKLYLGRLSSIGNVLE